jgi:phosphoglucosamine mutase
MNKAIFGTDGIRAYVGTPPLTAANLPLLGNALGSWIRMTYGKKARICIARDTRASSDWIISALCSGLLLYPITIQIIGVLPTPTLSRFLQSSGQFDAGIMISASHNPYHDNGIKIIDHNAHKLSKQAEQYITHAYYTHRLLTTHSYGTLEYYAEASQNYIQDIVSYFSSSFLKGITIVLDCAHGATYQVAPSIFTTLGAQVITIHAAPNGTNINKNCGSLYLQELQKAVLKHRATIGFAFDGDGDRVMAVNQHGIIKNGDDMLALLSNHPMYKHQKTIVGTIMSNLGLNHYLHTAAKQLVRTKVGDKHVADYILKHSLLLGGEQSGHIIMEDYLPTGDGIFTALRLCEVIIATNNWDLKTFDHYPQTIINMPVHLKKDLTDPEIAAIIKDYEAQLASGRLIVRYSGTENVLRIMIEDQSKTFINKIGKKLAHSLQKYLQ